MHGAPSGMQWPGPQDNFEADPKARVGGEGWLEATGQHGYTGLMGDGGACYICQRPYNKDTDSALYRLVEGGKRVPADPTGVHGRPYRACDYCGSIHPEDLYKGLKDQGWTLHGADWKYGWPHKFYVQRPGKDGRSEHLGKFYNAHLQDVKDAEAFKALTDLIQQKGSVRFWMQDGKLMYGAPHFDYQQA